MGAGGRPSPGRAEHYPPRGTLPVMADMRVVALTLVLGAVQVEHDAVHGRLVRHVHVLADERRRDHVVHVIHRVEHA